ncbi:MAG TPA: lamin tail domain-containing protein [Prolixibacteraceae bacterium]|nr:lamin tail domain-containing protein [Prolixibacteraceae bacterium]
MKIHQLLVLPVLLFCTGVHSIAQIQLGRGSEFNYLKGSEASNLPSDWYKPGFNDSGWKSGTAPFRYGKGSGGTLLSDMKSSYSTIYLRSTFTAYSVGQLTKIKLSANFDDGFVLWINGKQVCSQNAPSALNYSSLATTTHEYDVDYSVQLSTEELTLNEGTNTIAVMILNSTLGSSDIYFDMQFTATPQLPQLETTDQISFSKESGFCTSSFPLTLTSSSSDNKIIYTIDGSNPATSTTAITAGSPVTIQVDPASTAGRGKTPAFVVRAGLVKDGYSPTFPVSKTYIFTEAVKEQTYPGSDWPESSVNWQNIEYDMASDVMKNSSYSSQMDAALKEIPTISLSTDLGNFFDESEGIYVNASSKGEEWERECSVELIHPDGTKGFQVNAGVRIRGGNSAKNTANPKHGFRLFFRKEYGASKLEYPLFGKNGASEFDCIDLRCEQNYSWSMDGSPKNTMIKDLYCRKLQGLMGQPYARGFQFHLYLNGEYWGIYQTDERPEASFAETYLGGDKDDYDVVKVNTIPWPYYDEVTDGTLDKWTALWNLCQKGFDTNEKYFFLEGKDANGNRIDTATVWVDIDNLIDYMMVIFYSGNFDAPVSAWYNNDMPNNFFAIYNRKNRSMGFKFVAHDSEHCLFVDQVNIDNGIDENRVNIGSTGAMKITNVLDFNPQWLHYKLCSNAEYRLRFADRASKYLSEGGLLSSTRAKELFQELAEEMDTAIIAESARWGDAQTGGWGSQATSLTRDDDWLPEIENLYENYFPYRTDIVIEQLKDENLYPTLASPRFYAEENLVASDACSFSGDIHVKISNPNTKGEIFYTLDGTDPRLPGGAVSSKAITCGNGESVELTSTALIMARVKDGSNWGSLRKVRFSLSDEDYSNLKVTELNYHPSDEIIGNDTLDDKSLEYIEFKNIGSTYIDISGVKLDSAVTYTVPDNTLLAPGAFYVVASKTNSFFSRYGVYPSGNYKGQFSNSGEYVLLTDPSGSEILSFTYSDQSPWPTKADGDGNSLISVEENPTGDPNKSTYWKASSRKNGSPFRNDGDVTSVDPVVDPNLVAIYPNPTSRYLTVDICSFNNTAQETLIAILDLDGRILFSQKVSASSTIDLTTVLGKSGLYLLKAQFNHSNVIKKFMFTR